ncbi:ATP-binding protein [Amycolatopsis samaneae]|uniref:histidine kinase n=1 Tax=Amycolatopsis samaneae TaxID=664691 RepID=A0ABW5G8Z7_9PSEU
MYSNPPPAERPPGRSRRAWSLRRRLIVQLAALLTLVCLVVGVLTEFALREFLTGQLDNRLTAASDRGLKGPADRSPWNSGGRPPPDPLRVLGQGEGTLAVQVVHGSTANGKVLRSPKGKMDFQEVAQEDLRVLLMTPPNGSKRTVDLTIGKYRVVAGHNSKGDFTLVGLPMKDLTETLWRLGFIFAAVAFGGLVLTAAVGAATIRRTMKPLDRLAATATKVSELPLDRGEVALPVRVPDVDTDPRTEVGKVGSALNRMLGHIANALAARHASESRVRQFVADASHELRTPLAAIRGYAELTRRSRENVPPDIAFAMSRVESESARMTTLVEDLLLLARLDSGRPVVHEPVDLSRLVADAVADAHAAGPEHRWLLDVPGEPLEVLGDAGQLHQVVINILNNARAHTPPGTTVTADLSTQDGVVRLVVADDGPGIPPEVLPEVFERFARGDNSRSRAAGSTGLGLAIVAAVVAAHRGRVSVQSRPGRTAFEILFPVAPAHS